MAVNWKRRNYSKEEFVEAWESSLSIAQVLVKLGNAPKGGNYKTALLTAKELGLSDSHMTGQGWNVGDRFKSFGVKYPIDSILVVDSTYTFTHGLKLRLFNEGFFERVCSMCGLSEWMGQDIPLALDHINGINSDNRIENLRILCYNCHGQTETYCGKNIKKRVMLP